MAGPVAEPKAQSGAAGKGKVEKKSDQNQKWKHYEIKNNSLIRSTKFCPKCGQGVFMAKHKDRYSCGKCGYTEFLKR